jgi:hypothetical protein
MLISVVIHHPRGLETVPAGSASNHVFIPPGKIEGKIKKEEEKRRKEGNRII